MSIRKQPTGIQTNSSRRAQENHDLGRKKSNIVDNCLTNFLVDRVLELEDNIKNISSNSKNLSTRICELEDNIKNISSNSKNLSTRICELEYNMQHIFLYSGIEWTQNYDLFSILKSDIDFNDSATLFKTKIIFGDLLDTSIELYSSYEVHQWSEFVCEIVDTIGDNINTNNMHHMCNGKLTMGFDIISEAMRASVTHRNMTQKQGIDNFRLKEKTYKKTIQILKKYNVDLDMELCYDYDEEREKNFTIRTYINSYHNPNEMQEYVKKELGLMEVVEYVTDE